MSLLRVQVFLSYNREDSEAVEEVAERLRRDGIKPWFDRWSAVPGQTWQVQIAEALGAVSACAVFVGPHGLSDWAREELAVAQDRASRDRGFRLFMVLLPGATDLHDPALAFLSQRTWVDLRQAIRTADGHRELLRAITGLPPHEEVEFRFLGSLEVRRDDGEAVALGGAKQRALLAVLLLHANEVVSTERLVDELWGEQPPARAAHTVQVFVSRLRGALAAAGGRLTTRPPGYVLEVGADELDADRCERLYARGRAALAAAEPERAAALLREAEGLWRGPPLAEFTYEPFAQAVIARLEELLVSCREERIEAELALGRHAAVVSELEALVREQPLRERAHGQLMLALYRSGRQAEALDAFQKARRLLVEELGIEPGATLRELEHAILRQDPSLRAPSPGAAAVQLPGPAPESAGEVAPPPPGAGSPAPASEEPSAMVRRTVTVLVGRLAWPGLMGRTELERARRLTAIAREEAAGIVARHGGTLRPGLGGDVVGVFGLPQAQEDGALRALRAADELRTRVAELGEREASELVACVGVDTGEVVAEAPGHQPSLFGEPLDRSVALARAAQDGEVLLSDATRGLAPDAIRVEQAPDAGAWRLQELIPGAPAVVRRLGIPMVGRHDELATARAAFARVASGGNTQMLAVIGEAGLGKSRLAQELAAQLADEATILTGRCLSYGEGISYWPLREALEQAAGAESPEAIRAMLDDAEDADLVAGIIARALRLGAQEKVGEQVPWAFRRLFEALAQRRPVILVVDDAHWARPLLLDLLDYLVDWLTTAPVLLLCLARPELLEMRPAWGGGHRCVSSLVLAPLADEDATRLLNNQLGEGSLGATERAQILRTAEGNPLFVEQLLAMRTKDPRWNFEREIPATIEALLAARLDRLGPGERALLERAAIIGREFWLSAVVELLPTQAQPSADEYLRALVRRGLIRPERSTVSGEEALGFHHILVRDVTYRSTSKALRSQLHERFADWLERRGDEYDEFVGYHLEKAFNYRRELERPDAGVLALAVRAGERLAGAGRRALSRGDANAAGKLLRRSADLFGADGGRRPDVLLDLGSALSESGDFDGARDILNAALEEARATRSEALIARVLIELSYQRVLVDPGAGVRDMEAVAKQAIAVFDRLGDDVGLSRAWSHVAQAYWTSCQCAEMEQVLERALKHAERAGDPRERSRILSGLARATVIGPRPVDAGISRCLAILERAAEDVLLTAVTEAMLAVLEAMRGGFDMARDRWRQSKRRLEDVGLTVTLAGLQMYGAFIELLAGSPEDAELELAQAYAVLERVGERRRLPTTAALLARALYAQGRYDEAELYSQIAEEGASKDDVVSQVMWRGTRGKVLARKSESPHAEELVEDGVLRARQTDFLLLRADALTDHAEVLAMLHRHKEAARHLDQAVDLYERKGVIVSADAARRFRRSLASEAGAPGAETVRPA